VSTQPEKTWDVVLCLDVCLHWRASWQGGAKQCVMNTLLCHVDSVVIEMVMIIVIMMVSKHDDGRVTQLHNNV
jgi:hypothetical protein